jgi:hypothetical protein
MKSLTVVFCLILGDSFNYEREISGTSDLSSMSKELGHL